MTDSTSLETEIGFRMLEYEMTHLNHLDSSRSTSGPRDSTQIRQSPEQVVVMAAGKIYMKPVDQSRGQNAQLWAVIGGFEKGHQHYPGYDDRLAPAISREEFDNVMGQIKRYMDAHALFKGPTLCAICILFLPCCCYVHCAAGKIFVCIDRMCASYRFISSVPEFSSVLAHRGLQHLTTSNQWTVASTYQAVDFSYDIMIHNVNVY